MSCVTNYVPGSLLIVNGRTNTAVSSAAAPFRPGTKLTGAGYVAQLRGGRWMDVRVGFFLQKTIRAVDDSYLRVDTLDCSSLQSVSTVSAVVKRSGAGAPFSSTPRVAPWKNIKWTIAEACAAFLPFQ